MEDRIHEFINSNLKELEIKKQGVILNCTLKNRHFMVSPEGEVMIQGEIFNLPEGKNLYEKIHTEFRDRILNKFLNGTLEEPGYE